MTLTSAILNLWHISRTALAGQEKVPTRYDRMIYVRDELRAHHSDLITRFTPKYLWFEIEAAIS